MAKIKSLWQDDTSEFEQHLFQLITRIVSSDYARHLNHRRDFLPNAADVPYMYTHTVVGESSLSRVFGKMGILNSFFLRLGIFKGQYHMEDLVRQFHFNIYNPMFMQDPPFPDMQMLSFHATTVLVRKRFDGDFWKFASHFKEMYRLDLRRLHIQA